ncbi:MAG TPA: TonB-dependent receptor [Alphaproteobacteria bacterium]|nr:TonB-dependent receptor [Alphaproteobacteria bacterium]
MRIPRSLPLLTLAASALSGPAFAQSAGDQPAAAPAGGIEEIVVTAQRREEKLHDVPIAVTAFNAATIQERNITDINGIAGFAPNVTLVESPAFNSETTIAIRGGVTINPAIYWEPTVGIYVDGAYISKAQADVFDIADIDHIEILRGPQGTLYGRNTLNGAVNIVTQKPTGQFEGNIKAGFGDYGYKTGRLSVNLPAWGRLSVKVSGLIESRDGFITVEPDPFHLPTTSFPFAHAPTEGHLDSLDRKAGRIAAKLDITDDITADYAFDVSYEHDLPQPSQLASISPAIGFPANLYIQHNPQSLISYANGSYEDGGMFEDTSVRSHALTLTWDVSDELILKSITAYRWVNWSNAIDLDGTPMTLAATELFDTYHSFSQEVQAAGQIDRLHYTAGAYYFSDGGFNEGVQDFFEEAVRYYSNYGTRTEAYALYAQVEYVPPILDDNLTVTLGLRYSNENKVGFRAEYGSFFVQGFGFTPFLTQIPSVMAQKNFDAATPLYEVKYNISPDINVYAKYAEGFKSGGFNGESNSLIESITPFDAESVDEWEVGAKTRWLDNRLNINVAAFYDQRQNMQLSVFTAQGAVASVIRNAGSADIDGFEFEMQALPQPWLKVDGTVGYLNAQYNRFVSGGVNVANDRAFPVTPQFTAHMSVDATLMDNDIGKLDLIVDYNHSDAYYYYPYSLSKDPAVNQGYYAGTTKASPLNEVNARLRLTDIPVQYGKLEISMWGKNIFDDKARINGIDFGPGFGNLTTAYYNKPATFGGDVTFKW